MFIKAFRVKSSTPMKGSDKKKFKQTVKKAFLAACDDCSILDDLIPVKDEIILSKVFTHSGDSVLVYSVSKEPLFFELDKQEKVLLPTVYALWKCPLLLEGNHLTTVEGVLRKISNGADVMLPGVFANTRDLGLKAYCGGRLKKGDALYINVIENKAAVAVGLAALSSQDMFMAAKRGKAVTVLHCYGDQLWALGSKQQLPDLGRVTEDFGMGFGNGEGQIDDSHDGHSYDERETTAVVDGVDNLCVNSVDEDDKSATDDEQEEEEEEEEDSRSPEEVMNELLETAFLQALKTTAKKIDYPVLTSNFFRSHMVTACPPGKSLDVKKSSYKKISKFLEKMHNDEVIVVKEQKKGVEVIAQVNFDHEKLANFRAWSSENTVKEEVVPFGYVPPVITELNLVSANVANFFRSYGKSKGDGMTSVEVKECVQSYVSENGLENPSYPSVFKLDPVLAEVLLNKGENDLVTFRWDKVTSRLTGKMSKGYSMNFGNGRPPLIFKGKLEPIEMLLGNRCGNKKVTLIQNLDLYGIDMDEFAHKCQVGVAASTTVHEAPNKKRSGGKPVMEVLVQGNQVAFASRLLTDEYKVPRKYIRGFELAAKSKKGGGKK